MHSVWLVVERFHNDEKLPHIETLTSPVLQAVQVVEVMADKRRDLLQVVGANPGRQERLVGIPEGGIH